MNEVYQNMLIRLWISVPFYKRGLNLIDNGGKLSLSFEKSLQNFVLLNGQNIELFVKSNLWIKLKQKIHFPDSLLSQ